MANSENFECRPCPTLEDFKKMLVSMIVGIEGNIKRYISLDSISDIEKDLFLELNKFEEFFDCYRNEDLWDVLITISLIGNFLEKVNEKKSFSEEDALNIISKIRRFFKKEELRQTRLNTNNLVEEVLSLEKQTWKEYIEEFKNAINGIISIIKNREFLSDTEIMKLKDDSLEELNNLSLYLDFSLNYEDVKDVLEFIKCLEIEIFNSDFFVWDLLVDCRITKEERIDWMMQYIKLFLKEKSS